MQRYHAIGDVAQAQPALGAALARRRVVPEAWWEPQEARVCSTWSMHASIHRVRQQPSILKSFLSDCNSLLRMVPHTEAIRCYAG